MVVAANMAFAHIKGVARDPKDYEVYQPKVITKEVIKEVPVEVEKIVEKEVIKEVPVEVENPALKSRIVRDAIKHAKRAGEL